VKIDSRVRLEIIHVLNDGEMASFFIGKMTCLHATTTGCNNCKKSFPSAKNFRCAICIKKEDIEENTRENVNHRVNNFFEEHNQEHEDRPVREDHPIVKVAIVLFGDCIFVVVKILGKILNFFYIDRVVFFSSKKAWFFMDFLIIIQERAFSVAFSFFIFSSTLLFIFENLT
jgi:hypothetical protein